MQFNYSKDKAFQILLGVLIALSGYSFVWAQEKETKVFFNSSEKNISQDKFSLDETVDLSEFGKKKTESGQMAETESSDYLADYNFFEFNKTTKVPQQSLQKTDFQKPVDEVENHSKQLSDFDQSQRLSELKISPQSIPVEKFHWKPAIIESLCFLGIQHSLRLLQKKTTREFNGKFFRDWGKSVKNLNGWRDGDSFATNYFAHPMQGAVTGRIFINNSDRSKKLEFGSSKRYWESRFKAMAWSAFWSTQFEIGPISEASIGNVGLYDRVGPNRMGWVDMVVTPTAGTGVLIGEDIIDKYILKKWLEKKLTSRTKIKIYRTFFTPFQSFTNVLAGRAPWQRDNR